MARATTLDRAGIAPFHPHPKCHGQRGPQGHLWENEPERGRDESRPVGRVVRKDGNVDDTRARAREGRGSMK